MITDLDIQEVQKIKKFIEKFTNDYEHSDSSKFDWEKAEWIELLDKMVSNLKKAPLSYRNCTPEDIKNRFYTALCKCGWYGSSRLLDGGGQIADTGDYSDCSCPVCGNKDLEDLTEDQNVFRKYIAEEMTREELIERVCELNDRIAELTR